MSPCNCKPPFAHPVFIYMFTCIALCWKVKELGFTFICVSCPPRTVFSTFTHSISLTAILPAYIYEHWGLSICASCQVCLKHVQLSMEPIMSKVSSPRIRSMRQIDTMNSWSVCGRGCGWQGGLLTLGTMRTQNVKERKDSLNDKPDTFPKLTN